MNCHMFSMLASLLAGDWLTTNWLNAKLLLALARTGILGSEFHGTHDHTLLSVGSGSLQTTHIPVSRSAVGSDRIGGRLKQPRREFEYSFFFSFVQVNNAWSSTFPRVFVEVCLNERKGNFIFLLYVYKVHWLSEACSLPNKRLWHKSVSYFV
jgi:hypothetical protein